MSELLSQFPTKKALQHWLQQAKGSFLKHFSYQHGIGYLRAEHLAKGRRLSSSASLAQSRSQYHNSRDKILLQNSSEEMAPRLLSECYFPDCAIFPTLQLSRPYQ